MEGLSGGKERSLEIIGFETSSSGEENTDVVTCPFTFMEASIKLMLSYAIVL